MTEADGVHQLAATLGMNGVANGTFTNSQGVAVPCSIESAGNALTVKLLPPWWLADPFTFQRVAAPVTGMGGAVTPPSQ